MSQKKHADDQVFESFDKVGGPAFPSEWAMISGGVRSCPGMALRDWFAGQALAGMMAMPHDTHYGNFHSNCGDPFIGPAEYAYRMADAMLDARSKGDA